MSDKTLKGLFVLSVVSKLTFEKTAVRPAKITKLLRHFSNRNVYHIIYVRMFTDFAMIFWYIKTAKNMKSVL